MFANIFQAREKKLKMERTEQFQNMYLLWKHVFAEPNEVRNTTVGTHKIKLANEIPIKEASCQIPLFKRDVIGTEIDKLMRKGL